MSATELIDKAIAAGQHALSEADSKRVLAQYGVPVVEERRAADADQAAAIAQAMGWPVVLKGLGAKLTHKSELGLVRLGLTSAEAVRQAAAAMAATAGADLEGFLLQPQVAGRREFVAGLLTDDQFGPVVMFGLGGVFTEALDDAVFRIAPIDQAQALSMIDELRSRALLGPFRGEAAADRQQLAAALVGLSRLAMDEPRVREIDINPLLVSPDGQVRAVDALIVLGQAVRRSEARPPVSPAAMAALFHPNSVAYIGASDVFGKWGNRLFTDTLHGGFPGQVHLVNPKGGVIAGRPVHKSVLDIAEPVDLAVVTVPAAKVLALIPELKQKGVTSVVLVSSGFAEVGPEGQAMQDELVRAAREAGILILGPNTMGLCNPHHKFYCSGAGARPAPGATAFVAQSGNMGVQLLFFAEDQGIGIRAFAGSGNEAMLTVEDALDGFEADKLTKTVLLYLESVKDGRRFFQSASRLSRRKPVVALKGGRTAIGGKAAASHTGALASNNRVFEAACRQAGVVLADQPMDMLDLSAAFASLPLPAGRRVAIVTLGGGWGVVTSDLCSEYGLEVAELSPAIIAEIDKLLPPYWSRANPVDLAGEPDEKLPMTILDMLLDWDGCDAVIHLGIMGRKAMAQRLIDATLATNPDCDRQYLGQGRQILREIERGYVEHIVRAMERANKPVIGVSLDADPNDKTVVEIAGATFKGVFFQTPERAVKALAKMAGYESWLDAQGVPRQERGVRAD